MRVHPTPAEELLWRSISRRQLGVKFRRQQMIQFFIVDFYSLEVGLVIELDGSVHREQEPYDHERERVLLDNGCSILRFSNDEILYHLEESLLAIHTAILSLKSPLGDLGV
jgi:guanylate kinase